MIPTMIPSGRALSAADLLASYRRVVWGLLVVVALGVLGLTAWGILPIVLGPAGSYQDTLVIYAPGAGGREAIEWIVRLRIGGRLVEARCMSEGEALAIKSMMRR